MFVIFQLIGFILAVLNLFEVTHVSWLTVVLLLACDWIASFIVLFFVMILAFFSKLFK